MKHIFIIAILVSSGLSFTMPTSRVKGFTIVVTGGSVVVKLANATTAHEYKLYYGTDSNAMPERDATTTQDVSAATIVATTATHGVIKLTSAGITALADSGSGFTLTGLNASTEYKFKISRTKASTADAVESPLSSEKTVTTGT